MEHEEDIESGTLAPRMTLDRYRQRLHDFINYICERLGGYANAKRRYEQKCRRRDARWVRHDLAMVRMSRRQQERTQRRKRVDGDRVSGDAGFGSVSAA